MRRKKESGGGAHRGARALVGWREETGAVAFQRRREVERRPAKLRATLRLCEREEEARPSPTGEKMGRRAHDDSSYLGVGTTSAARPNLR
jgi:hypothetical protein